MWSCGITLGEMTTGTLFLDLPKDPTLQSVLSLHAPALDRFINLLQEIDDDYASLLVAAFATDPTQRPRVADAKRNMFSLARQHCMPITRDGAPILRCRKKTKAVQEVQPVDKKKQIRVGKGKIFTFL